MKYKNTVTKTATSRTQFDIDMAAELHLKAHYPSQDMTFGKRSRRPLGCWSARNR
jgi:hypothetical protein